MSEGEPRPSPDRDAGEPRAWESGDLAAALACLPEPAADVAFGTGLRFRLGQVQPVDLDLFPTSGVVRLTGGDVQITLFRQHAGPRLAPAGLIFELPTPPAGRFLAVSPAGEVSLFLATPQSTDSAARVQRPQDGPGVAEFDLGVKDQDDPSTTHWHRIVVFGARAEALQGGPKKGDLVDVIGGYTHVREITGKDGRKRTREEVCATVVKPR